MEKEDIVAILILLELTLQFIVVNFNNIEEFSRNPYFIGINSAMKVIEVIK